MKSGKTGEQKQGSEKTTIGTLIHNYAAAAGDKPALMYDNPARVLTYHELDTLSDAVAKGLIASGIKKGTSAAIWAANIPEYPVILLACAKAGIPIVGLNTSFRAYDMEYSLNLADAGVLFLASGSGRPGEYPDAVYETCPELKGCRPGSLVSSRLPCLQTVVFMGDEKHPGMFTWQEFIAEGGQVSAQELQARKDSVRPEDGFIFFLTSGTTGKPKCASWTHEAVLGNILHHSACLGLVPEDSICTPLPFFHAYGCEVLLSALTSGCSVAPLEKFNAGIFLRTIETFHATQLFGTPTMLVAALAEADRVAYDTSSLVGGNTAGSVVQPALMRGVMEKLGAKKFGVLYGLSEEICVTMTHHADPVECRSGSIGRPMPVTQLRFVNPGTGEDVAPGERGEILVKSPFMMTGYYHNPEATAAAIDKERFLHTGDLGYMDRDGYYHITGRSKDLIIRGGENISPSEIEEFILTHPAVMDAQVVGIKSEYYGEEPVAFVRLKPGQAVTALGLKQFCRRSIAIDKVPSTFFFVDQYPLTASGKVQKFRLREMAAESLSGQKR